MASIVALAMLTMLTAIGVGIDMSRNSALHSKMGNALDASGLAALNAASNIPCTIDPNDHAAVQGWVQEQGTKYFNANLPAGVMGSTPITPTFTLSEDGSSVLASANTNMSTPFLQIVGSSYVPVDTCSQIHIPLNGDLGPSATNTSPHVKGDIKTGLFTLASGSDGQGGTPGTVAVATNGVERLRVDASGNVGIGTQSAHGGVHIAHGDGQWGKWNYGADLVIDGTRNNAIALLDHTSSNPWAIVNSGVPSDGTSTSSRLQFASMPLLDDSSSKDTAPNVTMTLLSNGNVGIGTSTPQTALDVNGDVTINSAKATATTVNTANALADFLKTCGQAGGGTVSVDSTGKLACGAPVLVGGGSCDGRFIGSIWSCLPDQPWYFWGTGQSWSDAQHPSTGCTDGSHTLVLRISMDPTNPGAPEEFVCYR